MGKLSQRNRTEWLAEFWCILKKIIVDMGPKLGTGVFMFTCVRFHPIHFIHSASELVGYKFGCVQKRTSEKQKEHMYLAPHSANQRAIQINPVH